MQFPLSQSPSGAAPARSTNLTRVRAHISALFHGTSIHTGRPFTSSSSCGPKSPRSSNQLPCHSRVHIPQISTRPPLHSRSPTSTRSMIDPTSSPVSSTRPITAGSYVSVIISPTVPQQSHPASPTGFTGVDPERQYLARPTSDGRRRQGRKRRNVTVERRQRLPKIKSNAVRSKVRSCVISGISLTVVLTICATTSLPVSCSSLS